jgi:cell division transport system permease protein
VIQRSSSQIIGAVADGRLLLWLTMPLGFFSALLLFLAIFLGGVARNWEEGARNRMTIELPPPGRPGPAADARAQEWRDQAAAALDGLAGIAALRLVPRREAERLIEPHLGALAVGMPLPVLIDVQAKPGEAPSRAEIERRLAQVLPEANLVDHGAALSELGALARAAQRIAGLGLLLAAAGGAAAVALATGGAIAGAAQTVELLHLMGAERGFVARAFAARAIRQAGLGAAAGTALALVLLAVVALWVTPPPTALLPAQGMPILGWLAVATTPLFAAAIAAATAWLVVLRRLTRFD